MEMCRVCLSTQKELHQLDETFVVHYNLLTNLNISIMDGMPQFTCKTCLEAVKYFKEFRDKSLASEATLRNIISSNIKSEDEMFLAKYADEQYLKSGDNGLETIIFQIKVENDSDSDTVPENLGLPFEVYENGVSNLVKDESETVRDEGIKPKRLKKRIQNKRKQEILTTSRKKVHEDGSWRCGICAKEFGEEIDLNKHLDVHKDARQCELCKEKVNSLSQLLAHRLAHVPRQQMKCHICNKRYRSCLYLEYHYRNVHIEHDDPRLTCKTCLSSFISPKKLTSHILNVHSSVKFFCDVCSKGFCNKPNLKSHIKRHNMTKPYLCDLCEFTCYYSSGLKDHKVRRHSQEKINCKNCTRAFPSQQQYDSHKCKEQLKICTICGVQLIGNSRMSSHMARHSDVAKYECNRCPAKYKTKQALIVHTNRHDGNRTQQCEYCLAKFYSATVLIKHRRIHTGERPYICKICNKGFTGNHNLKLHMKVHGEYLIVKKSNEVDFNSVKNSTN